MRNKVINIEGGDQIGKATQTALLAKSLNAELYSFPNYESISGQLIRAALLTNRDDLFTHVTLARSTYNTWQGNIQYTLEEKRIDGRYSKIENPLQFHTLQFLNKWEAQPKILNTLKTSNIVMDRYDASALVYAAVDGVNTQWLRDMYKPIRKSDLTIVIMGDQYPREGELQDVNEIDKEYNIQVREAYEKFALLEGWHIVRTAPGDRETSIRETHKQILEIVRRELPELNENISRST